MENTGISARINEQLRPLAVPIEKLTLDPNNARDHDERSIESIKDSLMQFGQQKPVVVNKKGVVIAGNGTVQAAREMGWDVIAATRYDGEGDPEAFAIADNRTAELSRWDYRQLTHTLKDLSYNRGIDLEKLGWKDYELQPLLNAEWKPPILSDDELNPKKNDKRKVDLTSDQWHVINRAIEHVRTEASFKDMTDGRALELICADYLAGVVIAEEPPPDEVSEVESTFEQ